MNIKQSIELEQLRRPAKTSTKFARILSAEDMAQRVFSLAAQEGRVLSGTVRDWKNHWLASDRFVLMEIQASKAAIPVGVKDSNRVLKCLSASADSLEPIVVDVNKRQIGSTLSGYMPPVIVVDGTHRHRAANIQGRDYVLAWVGIRAARKLNGGKDIFADHDFGSNELTTKIQQSLSTKFGIPTSGLPINGSYPWVVEVYPFENYFIYNLDGRQYKLKFSMDEDDRSITLQGEPQQVITQYKNVKASKVDVAAQLNMPRQDQAVDGSAPHDRMPGVKGGVLYNRAGLPGGGRGGPGAADLPKVTLPGGKKSSGAHKKYIDDGADVTKKYVKNGKHLVRHLIDSGLDTDKVMDNKHNRAPGAGVGPRVAPRKGGSKSDMAHKLDAKGCKACGMQGADFIKKIVTDHAKAVKAGKFIFKKRMQGVTPPGCEDMVKGLKKSNVDNPYAVAWNHYNEHGGCDKSK